MALTDLHALLLSRAIECVLANGKAGAVVFVRCLTGDIVQGLAEAVAFAPEGWDVWRVAEAEDKSKRTITADHAVEMRESKAGPLLLLVDTSKAGAGMDGIYSSARELVEDEIFKEAFRLAASEVTKVLSRHHRIFAERAVKKARGRGRRGSVSPWTEFDFYTRVANDGKHPGTFLHLLGLWPLEEAKDVDDTKGLEVSLTFVDHLLGTTTSSMTPSKRIEALRLLNPSEEQVQALEEFLRSAAKRPLLTALAGLTDKRNLWVNALRIDGASHIIQGIDLIPWRNRGGGITKWSGLVEEGTKDDPPLLILRPPDASKTSDYSKLEIHWKVRPGNLEQGCVQYQVAIVTDMDEELATQEVTHSAKEVEKCRFTDDDFSMLSEGALIPATVKVSVIGNDTIEPQESEEFIIRFGEPPEQQKGGVGKKVRAFCEGLIDLENRDVVVDIASSSTPLSEDSRGFVLLRTPQHGRSFRVFRPSLIHKVEEQWCENNGAIGRWRVKARTSGSQASEVEFVPIARSQASVEAWDRAESASRGLAKRFTANGGGVGQVYDEKSKTFENVVKEYLLAWAILLEQETPNISLANTVEVQSLSGRTIGLIVLPSHPLRVAWHVAYDNLVIHARFEQKMAPKDIREELALLDGAMFPAFLPGLDGQSTFVFADTLGFHAVGMVLDRDKEPKSAIALLGRVLNVSETSDSVPTAGIQSSQVLGSEIIRYLQCHDNPKLLSIHALRPGDGLTVARSLGRVYQYLRDTRDEEEHEDEEIRQSGPSFVLELYPSEEQRGIAGRFIADAREKRRSGAGFLSPDDHWMLESIPLPGGVNLPRLRWARKNVQNPETAAHLALAFDTFESQVVTGHGAEIDSRRPIHAFGLLSYFERRYTSDPTPLWRSYIPIAEEGEKHPSDRFHTERLLRIHQAIQNCTARSLGGPGPDHPMLRTEISPDKEQNLRILHSLCDWVITVDRNAGIEYFDSPRENRDIYDAYVIDCVPEREDLGCLQLITSTSNLEEVRNLLDQALDQMGLSRSRRNAEFLFEELKAFSGRLAIRLTGQKAPTAELIALALSQANCRRVQETEESWPSLKNGFFVPVDDVRDLLPNLHNKDDVKDDKETRPDIIHVSLSSRKTLLFRFVEVKYRRHLRAARNPEDIRHIQNQIESFRERWNGRYGSDSLSSASRGTRRAKLARVLRFYADKARRHYLPETPYKELTSEIDRMISAGGSYIFGSARRCDRGFVFCPEYAGAEPLLISPVESETRVFLFGPELLPNSNFRQASITKPETPSERPMHDESVPLDGGRKLPRDTPATDEGHVEVSDGREEITGGEHVESVGEKDFTRRICFGTDVLTNANVEWALTIKGNPHLMIVGLPGMGKTTCLVNVSKQMLKNDIRPIVFSYHQDIDEKLESQVGPVRFVDFHGLGFNPLLVMDRESGHGYLDVAGAMRDIFIAIFPDLGDIQGERIRQAIKQSFIELGWDNPSIDRAALREPEFKRFLEILRDTPKSDRGLQTLLARLDELADYGIFDLGEPRGSLWDTDKPIVIRIHTTQNDILQRAFASLVFYGLYKDMFRRGVSERLTHGVIFDEAHRAAGLKLIPTMAKECRKYGISLVLASQEARDFNVSLFSTIANYLVLRLTDVDAKAVVRNVASSDQERVLVDRIKQLDRFKALYFRVDSKRPSYLSLTP